MKRIVLLLFSLLLVGCTAAEKPPAQFAGLTIEEHRLVRDNEKAWSAMLNTLREKPEILKKREQWRQLPLNEGYLLNLPREEQQRLIRYPIKVGETAVYLRFTEQWAVEVVRNGKVEFTYTHPKALYMTGPDNMVKNFTPWEGKWVLETVDEQVWVEGESLNKKLGHEKIFGFRTIAGKPFFFYMKDGKVQLSYDGQTLPQSYEKVPHYGCCDGELYNPRGSNQMVSFYGLRDGQWYWVDMGIYD